MVVQEDPSFEGNKDFKRDMFNVVIGIIWQTSLVAFPVFLVFANGKPSLLPLPLLLLLQCNPEIHLVE